MSNNQKPIINHPLSVIDGRRIKIKQAFSWVLNYYNPHKKIPEIIPRVLDSTCSEMIIWNNKDLDMFEVTTNDINPEIKADYNYCCSELHNYIEPESFDVIMYDPPYVDLKNRKDSEKYERVFNYKLMKNIKQLQKLTEDSALCFYKLLKKGGIIIAKITDFHYNTILRGSHDYVNWFSKYFYLFDKVVYRFYKSIPNLNFYNKRAAITHSYFMIFNKR